MVHVYHHLGLCIMHCGRSIVVVSACLHVLIFLPFVCALQFNPEQHVEEALQVLQTLESE